MEYIILIALILLIYYLNQDKSQDSGNKLGHAESTPHPPQRTSPKVKYSDSTVCHLAGAPYYIGGKQRSHMQIFRTNQVLSAVRDPKNQYDSKAIGLYLDNRKVGHIPKENNEEYSIHMDDGGRLQVKILRVDYDDPWRGVTIEITPLR